MPSTTPDEHWDRRDHRHRRLLARSARESFRCCRDLGAHVGPHLFGHLGDDLVVDVRLRAFGRGQHAGPIIESMALVVPLGCDRVSLGMPGRAWSLDDPVAPVSADGDLRQRVLATTAVESPDPSAPPTTTMALHPFDVVGRRLAWSRTLDAGPAEGWIPEALQTILGVRADLTASVDEAALRRQADRVEQLGHGVALTSLGRHLLGGDPLSAAG